MHTKQLRQLEHPVLLDEIVEYLAISCVASIEDFTFHGLLN